MSLRLEGFFKATNAGVHILSIVDCKRIILSGMFIYI